MVKRVRQQVKMAATRDYFLIMFCYYFLSEITDNGHVLGAKNIHTMLQEHAVLLIFVSDTNKLMSVFIALMVKICILIILITTNVMWFFYLRKMKFRLENIFDSI